MIINSSLNLLFPVYTWKKIPWLVNQFFKFLVKFLGVWPYILDASSFDVLLDLVPILAEDSQGFKKEIVFFCWPTAYFIFTILWLVCGRRTAYLLGNFYRHSLEVFISLNTLSIAIDLLCRKHTATRVLSDNR